MKMALNFLVYLVVVALFNIIRRSYRRRLSDSSTYCFFDLHYVEMKIWSHTVFSQYVAHVSER